MRHNALKMAALAVVAANHAQAQVTNVLNELSLDGVAVDFSRRSIPVTDDSSWRVRVRLQGATATGLGGLNFQPSMTNWHPELGDIRIPFTFPGLASNGATTSESAYDGRQVMNMPANVGRIFPFGAIGQGQTSRSGLLTSFNTTGNLLCFAGANNEPLSLTAAHGVDVAQYPASLAGTNFMPGTDVVVFKYAITIGAQSPSSRTLTAQSPANLMSGPVVWFRNPNGLNSLLTSQTQITTTTASVHVNVVPHCPADIDDGTNTGTPNGGVDINDLLYFLARFEAGGIQADLDDGSGLGVPNGGVDINDLPFFLAHFESGC